MKTLHLDQGTPEWHVHRAVHRNSSDAPAMLGCSPYKKRTELLKERATGAAAEVDAGTQRRFDDGHRFEALARPLAEEIVGEDLFPVTGCEGPYSASFDGLTLMEDVAFEHKSLNDDLRAMMVEGCTGADLAKHYQVQMEQQCMVSGANRVLFMASKWAGETLIEERHCWYVPNPDLRKEIVAGWAQFEADLAAYTPELIKAEVVAAPVVGFGALSLRVEGRVLASNLDDFRAGADAFLARLPKATELQTDQDFANADAAVKECAETEGRIEAARSAALAQMADVDAVLRAADDVREAIRAARLVLANAVKTEKENRKTQLVRAGIDAVRDHYSAINATMPGYEIGVPASLNSEIAAATKGLKSIDSIRDKIDGAVAQAKITASQESDRRRLSIAVIDQHAEHRALIPDAVTLVAAKSAEDLRNLIAARVAEHRAKEQKRLDDERARIRAEEEAKAKREADEKAEADRVRIREEERQRAIDEAAAAAPPATHTPPPVYAAAANSGTPSARAAAPPTSAGAAPMPAAKSGARIKLGDINARIAPLNISAQGLAEIGFQPVGSEGAAKLYAESDFAGICNVLSARLQQAAQMQEAA